MMLTAHFSLHEFTVSETAARRGIDNTPNPIHERNLLRVANMLERVRSLLGDRVITITSGYRCQMLNFAIGGATNSAHVEGLAADFICPAFGSPLDVCKAIEGSDIGFDQLIHEYGRWVHLSLPQTGRAPRRDRLTIDFDMATQRARTRAGVLET